MTRRLPLLSLIGLALFAAAAPADAATGNISTIVGTGTPGGAGDGGPAGSAQTTIPITITATSDGGYLFGEQGDDRVRRVSPSGIITAVAGSGAHGFSGDGGPATDAAFSAINGVAVLPDGSILIADSNNNRIRKVGTDGIINTVVGNGVASSTGDGGPAAAATVNFPDNLLVLADGSYLITENDGHRVRKVDTAGNISTVAGTGTQGDTGDGGPAVDAEIAGPAGLAATADGGYLIAEMQGARIRKVDAAGNISTVAGTGVPGFSGDGGPATAAQFAYNGGTQIGPADVETMPDGGYVVADTSNSRIRRVAPDGTITTLAGTGTVGFSGDGGPPAQADMSRPFGVAVTPEGDVLIADTDNSRVRHIDLGDPAPPPPPPPANSPTSVTLAPKTANRTPGDAPGVTATVKLRDGTPARGTQLRYAVTGANAVSGLFSTRGDGTAPVPWDGVHDGADSVRVWVDLNGNGRFDFGEPADTATVTWVLPAPVVAKTVNIEPVKGKVFVKLPKKKGSRVSAAQAAGFIPLDEAKNVPVGTIVDTHQGTVNLTSAATLTKGGATQASDFSKGNFQIKQGRARQPITELVLNDKLTCTSAKTNAAAKKVKTRQLWGRGKGRFRTRGRHSTATVRGTYWITKDSCDATTTVVREGTVIVRDLAKKKDVKVKAGHRYTAHAVKKNKKRKKG